MKILVICQYYYPEPFRITDICEELANRGHEVTVVTGTPNYPMGEIYEGYENSKRADEVINSVKVHRCNTAPRKTGTLNRILNYFSYAYHSKQYVKQMPGDFDVVFINQLSPVMMADAGILYKRKHGKKAVLYSLDLWPESLCVGGIKKGSVVYKIFKTISKRIYRATDEILITSRMFKSYFTDMFGIDEQRISYLPQYAEAQFLELGEKKPSEDFNILFAGNIGTAQSLDTAVKAMRILKEENIKLHIVGDGTELSALKAEAADLENIIFYGRKPLEDMPEFYKNADAMLITLTDDPIISLTLPGKVQTYMAAGKPIVGAAGGETQAVLNESQGGYCGAAKDSEALAKNILAIRNADLEKIGTANRNYYINNFSKDAFIDTLLKKIGR